MDAAVFGNVTLDVLCFPVNDVPRDESIPFDRVAVGPGGCGSNVAVGLCALGVPTGLVARIGVDDSADLVEQYWRRVGLDTRFVQRVPDRQTAVSIGLVDTDAQPRFIHTPGANADLTVEALDLPAIVAAGARALHVAGFLILPGVEGERMAAALAAAREHGLFTSLDVVLTRTKNDPAALWPCLPHIDYFLCNAREAQHLTGEQDPVTAALALQERGGRTVIVKMGGQGCWAAGEGWAGYVPARVTAVVDTTGAGDAFAAGLIAALLRGADLEAACMAAHAAAARVVGSLGTVAAWFES